MDFNLQSWNILSGIEVIPVKNWNSLNDVYVLLLPNTPSSVVAAAASSYDNSPSSSVSKAVTSFAFNWTSLNTIISDAGGGVEEEANDNPESLLVMV